MFRLIRSLLDPRPVPVHQLPATIRDDAMLVIDGDPQPTWDECWARSEAASAALSAALARVNAARLAYEAAIAESEEAARVEEAAYQAMMKAKASSNTVH